MTLFKEKSEEMDCRSQLKYIQNCRIAWDNLILFFPDAAECNLETFKKQLDLYLSWDEEQQQRLMQYYLNGEDKVESGTKMSDSLFEKFMLVNADQRLHLIRDIEGKSDPVIVNELIRRISRGMNTVSSVYNEEVKKKTMKCLKCDHIEYLTKYWQNHQEGNAPAADEFVGEWYVKAKHKSHICNDRTLFFEFQTCEEKLLKISRKKLTVKGVGCLRVQNKYQTFTLQNVLYVPESDANYLSLKTLVNRRNNHKFMTENRKATIYDHNNEILLTGKLLKKSFRTTLKVFKPKD